MNLIIDPIPEDTRHVPGEKTVYVPRAPQIYVPRTPTIKLPPDSPFFHTLTEELRTAPKMDRRSLLRQIEGWIDTNRKKLEITDELKHFSLEIAWSQGQLIQYVQHWGLHEEAGFDPTLFEDYAQERLGLGKTQTDKYHAMITLPTEWFWGLHLYDKFEAAAEIGIACDEVRRLLFDYLLEDASFRRIHAGRMAADQLRERDPQASARQLRAAAKAAVEDRRPRLQRMTLTEVMTDAGKRIKAAGQLVRRIQELLPGEAHAAERERRLEEVQELLIIELGPVLVLPPGPPAGPDGPLDGGPGPGGGMSSDGPGADGDKPSAGPEGAGTKGKGRRKYTRPKPAAKEAETGGETGSSALKNEQDGDNTKESEEANAGDDATQQANSDAPPSPTGGLEDRGGSPAGQDQGHPPANDQNGSKKHSDGAIYSNDLIIDLEEDQDDQNQDDQGRAENDGQDDQGQTEDNGQNEHNGQDDQDQDQTGQSDQDQTGQSDQDQDDQDQGQTHGSGDSGDDEDNDTEHEANLLLGTLDHIFVEANQLLSAWDSRRVELSYPLQRVLFRRAVSSFDLLFDLGQQFRPGASVLVTEDTAAPAPALQQVPADDIPLDDSIAEPPFDLPEDLNSHEELLCTLASRIHQANVRSTRVLTAWNEGAEISFPYQEELYDAALAVQPLVGRLMDAFAEGADIADAIDEEAQQEFALQRDFNTYRTVVLGTSSPPEDWGVFGMRPDGVPVATTHDGGQVILNAGVLHSGKSLATLAKLETMLKHRPGLNAPGDKLTTAFAFHADLLGDSPPEMLTALLENPDEQDCDLLLQSYFTGPAALDRLVMVVPPWMLDRKRRQVRPFMDLGLQVRPAQFRLPNLTEVGIEALLCGDKDTDALYLQQMLDQYRAGGPGFTMGKWRDEIFRAKDMTTQGKNLANQRLNRLEPFINEKGELLDLAQAGQLTLFDLGGPRMGRGRVLPLTVALMSGLMQPMTGNRAALQRVFSLDEINRMQKLRPVLELLVTVARGIRHHGSTLMLSGQDFIDLPDALIQLATQLEVFRLRSRAVYLHLCQHQSGLLKWAFQRIQELPVGAAVVLAVEAFGDPEWRNEGRLVYFRPTLCCPGGETRTRI